MSIADDMRNVKDRLATIELAYAYNQSAAGFN